MYLQKNSIDIYWDPLWVFQTAFDQNERVTFQMRGTLEFRGLSIWPLFFLLSKDVEVEWTQKSPSGGKNGYPRDNLKANNQIFQWEMACIEYLCKWLKD